MDNIWLIASIWVALAFVASLISIRIGLSVALVEIAVGVVGGNFLGLHSTPWTDFLASFGSVLLTFLAGAEIDPASFRKHLKPSLVIGIAGFLFPFLGAGAFAYFVANWDLRAAEIAGIALSTTSVAVVYAVMVETGFNETDLGKLILAACFVNDLGTVLALGLLFANFDIWMVVFVVITAVVLWQLPRVTRWVIANWGGKVSEPEVKFIFLVLFVLGWLASAAKSEAVLPAYLIGLVVAGVFLHDKVLVYRMRSIAFTMLTPFYFLRAGSLVAIPAVVSAFGLVVAFLAVKMGAKLVGVWPLTRAFKMNLREGNYTTMLMSTGLTFGTISSLYGLTNNIINQLQYSVLVTVVIGSAIVPTLIAQTFFMPERSEPENVAVPLALVESQDGLETAGAAEGSREEE
ncbi:MAG: cation:proton antiporter [Dehalococcoidales bacterium]|nr:cation:proton antiporter [Dehalococcoidales bacterium]